LSIYIRIPYYQLHAQYSYFTRRVFKLERYRLRTSSYVSGMPFSALLGGKSAGEATDTPEEEGFGDEKDAAQRRWCTYSGSDLWGKRAYDSKGNEKKEGSREDCFGATLGPMTRSGF
jgi:hypothetical protein